MKAPIILLYLRSLGRLGKRARAAEFQRDDALELVADLRYEVEVLEEESAGWQRRAEALADALPPDLVQAIFGVLDTVERLPEVEAGHGNQ